MPSVIVSWTGHCREDSARRDLCDKLAEIAQLGTPFLGAPAVIKRFDHQIGGNILLSTAALEQEGLSQAINAERLPETSVGLALLTSGEDPSQKERPDLVHTPKLGESSSSLILSLSSASLVGIEFRFPNFYSEDENRVSFVFLLSPNPALDGLVVQVENKKECQEFKNKAIRGADWFLRKSSIHLRQHCEEWMDFLLGWLKRFYIPDLRYWRHDWLPGYEWLSKIDPNNIGQRDQLFEVLKESLAMECRSWPHIRDEDRKSFWDKLAALETLHTVSMGASALIRSVAGSANLDRMGAQRPDDGTTRTSL